MVQISQCIFCNTTILYNSVIPCSKQTQIQSWAVSKALPGISQTCLKLAEVHTEARGKDRNSAVPADRKNNQDKKSQPGVTGLCDDSKVWRPGEITLSFSNPVLLNGERLRKYGNYYYSFPFSPKTIRPLGTHRSLDLTLFLSSHLPFN